MVGLWFISRLRARSKRKSTPISKTSQAELCFSVDKIWTLILSFQDGSPSGSWLMEDGNLAADLGHLELMKARHREFRYSVDAMDRAAKAGHVEILEFLWRLGQECTTKAMDSAAKEGHLEVIAWLQAKTTAGATKSAMDQAAASGHLSTLKWLHRYRREGCTVSAMNWAAEKGHLDVVEWLHHNRRGRDWCTTAAFDRAAMNNHMDVITWLISNRSEGGTQKALQFAVGRGHTEMVRLLSIPRRGSNAARLPKQASSLTAGSWSSVDSVVLNLISPAAHTKRGSSSSVELERRRVRFFCSKFAMDKAAQGGHMSVLQLLHDQGHSCTTNAMNWAAAFGQLETVKWLSENRSEGCTEDAMGIDHAAANGHLETVKWLHQNRREGCTIYALTDAAGYGHLEMVKWLDRNRHEGCGREAMDDAAENGHLEIVRWLCRNRVEGCSREALEGAARNGHLEVVRLLHDIRVPCTATAIHLAYLHGHMDVYNFLGDMYPDKKSAMDLNTPDSIIVAEREIIEDDKKRDMELEKEARRRRQSVLLSSDGNQSKRNERRRQSLPIKFGQDGKPSLSPIKTVGI
ncbi:unnamed protein product [Ascophyllum nodosum]